MFTANVLPTKLMERSCPYCGDTFDSTQGVGQHCRRVHDGKSWIPEDQLRDLYKDRGHSTEYIANRFDTTKKTIRLTLNRYGIEQRDAVEERQRGLLRKPASFGTIPNGYEECKTEHDGELDRIYIHRLLAVAKFGFDEVAESDVHHINKIPWDNRPENIDLIDPSDHARLHSIERWEREAES